MAYLKLFITFLLILLPLKLSAEDCRFGLLLPLTGEYTSTGDECQMGIELGHLRNENNGLDIKYITGDTKAIGKDSVNEFKKVVSANKADAALVVRSTAGMAINPLSKKDQVPILGIVGHQEFIGQNPYAFRYWPNSESEASALADVAKQRRQKKLAILTTEDDWLLSFGKSYIKRHKSNGGEIVYEDTITPDYTEYKTIIARIKSKKPDAVFINLGIVHLSTFIKQARALGLTQDLYAIFWVKTQDVINANSKENMANITFVEIDTTQKSFYAKFKEKYPEIEPSAVTYTCYSAIETLNQACKLKKENGTSTYEALNSIGFFPTYDQDLEIKNREVLYKLVVKQFQADGKIVQLD